MTEQNTIMDKIVEEFDFQMPKPGDTVDGIIIAKEPGYILLSIGGCAIGIISGKEMHDGFASTKDIKVGDTLSTFVLDNENDEGMMVLSLRKANQMKNWDFFEKCLHDGTTIEVVAREANKGGLICDANGIHAFLPVSQLAPKHYPRVDGANAQAIIDKIAEFIGKKFTVRVITFLRNDKIIVSERDAISEIREKELRNLKVGQEVDGEVNGVVKFGIFITFGELEGLIHTSELSWENIRNHYDMFKLGDKVKAQVIGIDGDKISLSIKRLQKDHWSELIQKYPAGTKTTGVVNKITNFGLFVTLQGNFNGLVHVSEFKDKDMRPSELATVGDEIKVRVLGVNEEDSNLKLTVKLDDDKKDSKKADKTEKTEKAEEEKQD